MFFTGESLYQGIPFTTAIECLTALGNNLAVAGWAVVEDGIAAETPYLVMQGTTTNGHSCYIVFSVDDESLNIQGDLDGADTHLSPLLSLQIDEGETNRLWLTADGDSGAVCIRNRYTYSGGAAFGFLARFDETDADAWMVSKLNNRLNDAYVAKSKHDGAIWKQIGADFAEADNFTSATLNGGYQGILDFVTIPNPYISFFNTNRKNAGYTAHLGQVNKQDDRPVITRRFYLEGRGASDNYNPENSLPARLYNRGYIKHVANGLGKLPGGASYQDENGDRYLSVGGEGWQGLLIDSIVVESESSPTIFRAGVSLAGEIIQTGAGLKAEIRNTLLNAGWSVVAEDEIRTLFKGKHESSDTYCYLRLEVGDGEIKIAGDANGDETYLSPYFSLNYIEGAINRIWETANGQSIAICLKDGNSQYKGVWIGFFDSDTPRWGIGYISTNPQDNYVVKGSQWRSIAEGFNYSTTEFSSFPVTTFDRLSTASTPVSYFDNEDPSNSAIYAYNGQVNGATGEPQLAFYAIVEGAEDELSYGLIAEGDGNAPKLNYLGTVEFLATGLSSLSGGAIVTSPGGAKYLSCGGIGWQGMRIN
ncbi:MAG: hypothetical protein QNJ41_12005 [Xenococcaceae cyanobacterium MO_188.B32]|nr:hypothetical protein [Xenococcaceae cyanobacterium MO_188.B32]